MGTLKDMSEKYKAALDAKEKKLEKMKEALKGKRTTLSPEKLSAKEKELQKK